MNPHGMSSNDLTGFGFSNQNYVFLG